MKDCLKKVAFRAVVALILCSPCMQMGTLIVLFECAVIERLGLCVREVIIGGVFLFILLMLSLLILVLFLNSVGNTRNR